MFLKIFQGANSKSITMLQVSNTESENALNLALKFFFFRLTLKAK